MNTEFKNLCNTLKTEEIEESIFNKPLEDGTLCAKDAYLDEKEIIYYELGDYTYWRYIAGKCYSTHIPQ